VSGYKSEARTAWNLRLANSVAKTREEFNAELEVVAKEAEATGDVAFACLNRALQDTEINIILNEQAQAYIFCYSVLGMSFAPRENEPELTTTHIGNA
jgi:hypothetical protein